MVNTKTRICFREENCLELWDSNLSLILSQTNGTNYREEGEKYVRLDFAFAERKQKARKLPGNRLRLEEIVW